MTPEEARQLLEGTTPTPWTVNTETYQTRRGLAVADFWITDRYDRQVAGQDVTERHREETENDFSLMAAAPDMAAMIAGMRTEYKMEVRDQHGKWHHGGWTDDPARCFEPSFFGLKITACRLVRRYVISPQPLGEEQ